jgi:protein TonB
MLPRYLFAVLTASVTTLALFALMDALIRIAPAQLADSRPRYELGISRVIEETQLREQDLIHEIDPPEPPPPGRPELIEDTDGASVSVNFKVPTPSGSYDPTSTTPHLSDGPLATIVRVQPAYPPAAERRELEGWVVVEFDVTAAGGVENARVIESSHSVFEAAALRAVSRFRYRPRIVDGVALPTRAVRNRFRFDMERG